MQNPVWSEAIARSADAKRAAHYWHALQETPAAPRLKQVHAPEAQALAALFSGSPVLSDHLVRHPELVADCLELDALRHPRMLQGLERELTRLTREALARHDYATAFDQIRAFKQRLLLRIGLRDLAGLAPLGELLGELSSLAEVCLAAVYRICRAQLVERLGQPWHRDAEGAWQPTAFCVFGLGKLGGQELNYSSDVDLIFVYDEEGHAFRDAPRRASEAGKGVTSHAWFKRLAETFVTEVTRVTTEGTLYRIDLRLRPEGDTGPIVRSLPGYENYYAQWGQTWERMMLMKARLVAGDPALANEFQEMVNPFRYPRGVGEGVLAEVGAIKQRVEREVVRAGELHRNVKLGRGGIREVEFVAQLLQLLHAGHIPFLQGAQTLPTLQKLVSYGLLSPAEAEGLAQAYRFLRQVEHRLQMEQGLQTHTVPTERRARERLAALMGFATLKEFEAALQGHMQRVREVYEFLLQAEPPPRDDLPASFQEQAADWTALLARHSFRDPDKALRVLQGFVHGPGYGHVSSRTVELARLLLRKALALCPRADSPRPPGPPAIIGDAAAKVLSDPDRVLTRLDTYVGAYGARAALFETWARHPSLFELLLLMFDRSEFLAESAIRTPDLVDELVLSGHLRRAKSAAPILADLEHGLEDADQKLWLRRYHQSELMRIGLRDILGLADFEQNLSELSALAEACLQYALRVLLRQHRLEGVPLAIVGLGKLGGAELNYGSDLDVLFVAESKTRPLPALQRVAAEVLDLLSSPTELGTAFLTDARLRPDGEKGLLVNTLDACADYYRQRAQLWEIQALSRSRVLAGPADLGARWHALAAELTDFSRAQPVAAAFRPDWRQEIARMRARIERERTPAGKEALAFKTGAGGLMDAEFIAQTLALAHGWQEPNTLRALERARTAHALPADTAAPLIDSYRQLRRIEGVLRRWSYAPESLFPDDPAPMYRVAVRCGFANADEFTRHVATLRQRIRSAYERVFAEPSP